MYRNRNITPDLLLIDALKKMDALDRKLLIVLNENKFVGLLSAGDIQRAIISGRDLNSPVKEVMRTQIKTGKPGDSLDQIRSLMAEFRMEFYPIISNENEVEEMIFWEDLFVDVESPKAQFDLPVVIMAGGLGTRLRPLTNVIPKPLIPIGDKTMLEEIFDRFAQFGCSTFHLSVNYKADLIKYYLEEQHLPYSIDYFKEDKPLGTAGSLTLLKGKLDRTFFVNNCDIIIKEDYSEIINYHRTHKNDITLVAAVKSYHIPYGTVVSGEEGQLVELREKPEMNFLINSGMYLLEPHLLDQIPSDTMYHITHLIEDVKNKGGKVGVFPVSEKAWIDMGDWAEYLDHIKADHKG
jgi:dTDP-glucose pyrophosphorylase